MAPSLALAAVSSVSVGFPKPMALEFVFPLTSNFTFGEAFPTPRFPLGSRTTSSVSVLEPDASLLEAPSI